MWIRSQDKRNLVNVKAFVIVKTVICGNIDGGVNGTGTLGSYATEQRALEILDDIENQLTTLVESDNIIAGERITSVFVYQMPEK